VEELHQAGVPAELDVYPTNVHAFDMLYPANALSRQAIRTFEQRFGDVITKCETSSSN
jgi:acetyl esterase/lipase